MKEDRSKKRAILYLF